MVARFVVRLALVAFLWRALAGEPALALRLSGSFAPIAPGLEVAEGAVVFDGGDAEVPLTLTRVDPTVHGVRLATPADMTRPAGLDVAGVISPDTGQAGPPSAAATGGYTLREYFEGLGAAAAAPGSLLASLTPPEPLGLVVANGRVLSPPHRSWASSGLFCTATEGAASIRPFDPSEPPAGGAVDCLQSGPLLVGPDGVAPADRLRRSIGVDYTRDFVEGRHRRAFVALDRRGRVLLGVTGPLDLARLAEFMAVAADPEVLDVAAALNLTGAETAGLLVRAEEVEVRAGEPDGVPLPNAIAVLPPADATGPNPEPGDDRPPNPPGG